MKKERLPNLLFPLILLSFFLSACGSETGSSDSSSAKSGSIGGSTGSTEGAPIILISIDTLRSDRLPIYGYDKIATPTIDAFRADSILYERAWANYPITLPSHVTMMTGLLSTEHGVRDNVGYRMDDDLPRLTLALKEAGYTNGASVSAYILRRDTGMGLGFDWYEDSLGLRTGAVLADSQRSGEETIARSIEWMREVREEPFFLLLHLYEPHMPYTPPEPYASLYDDPYDGEIALVDSQLKGLFDALRELGVYDDAIIVLTSDHGEGLNDHGEEEHGILLYREALQIPMLLKLPGNRHAGASVEVAAQLTDIAPTLAQLAGANLDLSAYPDAEGRGTLLDLLEEGAEDRRIYAETYYPRIHLGWSDLASLVEGDLHYIEGPNPELYDIGEDPAETLNVLRDRRSDYARLRDATAALRTELEAPAEVDPETAERLAALGYLAGPAVETDGPLPDPRSQLPVLDSLRQAFFLFEERRYDEAAQTFRAVVEANPNMPDAWEHYALTLRHIGQIDEAIQAYRKALELTGGSDHIALGLARMYLETEEWSEARAHAELALPTNPVMAHQVLAKASLGEKDAAGVQRHAQASLDARPGHVTAYSLLAQGAVLREDFAAAEKHLGDAFAAHAKRAGEDPPPGLHYARGELAARLGRTEQARVDFLEEMRLYPNDTRPYTRLAVLEVLVGRPQEAVGLLQRMVEASPSPMSYAAAVDTLRVLGDRGQADRLLQYALSLFPESPQLRALAGS